MNTYIQLTMSQEVLTELTISSLKKQIVEYLNYANLVNTLLPNHRD